MYEPQLFSARCWQLVDLIRLPVSTLQVVQSLHDRFKFSENAGDVIKAAQQPVYRYLQLPWVGPAERLARRNRARFNVYHQLVEETFQCPDFVDLTILSDALEVWIDRIERESAEQSFSRHPRVGWMTSLITPIGGSIADSEIWSLLQELQKELLQLSAMVSDAETDLTIEQQLIKRKLAAPHWS